MDDRPLDPDSFGQFVAILDDRAVKYVVRNGRVIAFGRLDAINAEVRRGLGRHREALIEHADVLASGVQGEWEF